jgi:hypothetical protein
MQQRTPARFQRVEGDSLNDMLRKYFEKVTLTRFSGHLDCSEMFAQKGVQDGHTVPGRVPRAGGGVSEAA